MSSTKCSAIDVETGKPCLCLKCTLPDNPDPEKPLRCLECLHGPSHHRGDTSSSRNVNEILRGLLGPSSASGSRSVSLTEANEEANNGLMRSQLSRGTRKTTGVSHNKSKGKKKDDGDGQFKVLSVVINPDGVEHDEDNKLQIIEDQVPGKFEIQMLVKRGLARMDEQGIPFKMSWSHAEVDNALHDLFPKVFTYLDALETPDPDGEFQGIPRWLLCVPMRRRMQLVPEMHPTGSTLHYNKGTTRAGFRESKIFIVTRNAIPEAVQDFLADEDTLAFGTKGKGKATPNLFARSPDSDSDSDNHSRFGKRRKRSVSPVLSSSDGENLGKRRSKRRRARTARYAESGLLNDCLAQEIGMLTGSESPQNRAASSDNEQAVNVDNWIDLTVPESSAVGGSSTQTISAHAPSPASPMFLMTTPPRPTLQPNPSFTVTSSDNDNDLDDPWAKNRTFTF